MFMLSGKLLSNMQCSEVLNTKLVLCLFGRFVHPAPFSNYYISVIGLLQGPAVDRLYYSNQILQFTQRHLKSEIIMNVIECLYSTNDR